MRSNDGNLLCWGRCPQSKGATGVRAALGLLLGNKQVYRCSPGLCEHEEEPDWFTKHHWPPEHQAHLTKLRGKDANLITALRTVQGGGKHSGHHPTQWTKAKTKGCARRERANMWHLPTVCGDSKPAPNAGIITGERNKENLVMDNVNTFGTFKSNELDIPTALDFKSTPPQAGEK